MTLTDRIYQRFDYMCGGIILLTVCFCYVIMQLCWLAGISSLYIALPLAFISACLCICWPFQRNLIKPKLRAIIISFCIITALIFLASLWTDASFDGICYHQEQIALIFGGWNPCLRPLEPEVSAIWVNHYPMALETVGAAFMAISGHLQSGKAIMPIMAIMTFFLCKALLAQIIPNLKDNIRLWIAILITCNPVVIAQLLSSYVDGTIAEYIVLTILLAVAIVVRKNAGWKNYILLAAVIIMAIGTKFNALLYELITAILLFIGFWIFGYLRGSAKFFTISIIFGVFGVFLFSYYPYVTNWITAGHPLYPLAGDNSIDIITDFTRNNFGQDSNRFLNFFQSIYTVKLRSGAGSEIMGFSITFMILFPLSIAIVIIDAIHRHKFTPELYAMICMIGVCFIFEACWWARYIPHLWLLVPLSYYTINRYKYRYARLISTVIGSLSIIGVSLIFIYCIFGTYRYSSHRTALYRALQGDTVPMTGAYPQFKRLMEEHDITVINIDIDITPSELLTNKSKHGLPHHIIDRYSLYGYGEPMFFHWQDYYIWLTPDQKHRLDNELRNTSFYHLYHIVRPNHPIIGFYNEPLHQLREFPVSE